MSLSALIAALLLEQLNALAERNYLPAWLSGYVGYFQHHFNSGAYHHGRTAWWLATIPSVIASIVLFWGLHRLHPILSWAFDVLVLYLCMGFGRYRQIYAGIQLALRGADMPGARSLLSQLRGVGADESGPEEIARLAIESTLMVALNRLFAVIVWFVVTSFLGLGGAAGVLFYCMSLAMPGESDDEFMSYARKMRTSLDWLPIRLTAATFAIVGNFEDTAYCWRSQASGWPDPEKGILLASAAGASGIRLGSGRSDAGSPELGVGSPELGVGNKSGAEALYCIDRLLKRSSVFILVTLFMLTLAGLLK